MTVNIFSLQWTQAQPSEHLCSHPTPKKAPPECAHLSTRSPITCLHRPDIVALLNCRWEEGADAGCTSQSPHPLTCLFPFSRPLLTHKIGDLSSGSTRPNTCFLRVCKARSRLSGFILEANTEAGNNRRCDPPRAMNTLPHSE